MAEERSQAVGVPAWIVYSVAVVVWPLWVELFVFLEVIVQSVRSAMRASSLGSISLAVGILAATLASFGLGSLVRRWAPRGLWVVTIVWLAVAVTVAVFGFSIADQRDVVGLLGVAGPFLFGAIGFTAGMRRP